MKPRNWTRTLAAARRRLVKLGNLTPECSRHPALRAIATLCLAAAADIECHPIPNSVGADLRMPGYAEPADAVLQNLLAEIAASIQSRLQGSSHGWFNPTHWLQEFGLDEFVRLSIEADRADEPRRALLTEAAEAARQLNDRIRTLSSQHGTAVMTRDLPGLLQDWEQLPASEIAWLLVHDRDGDTSRGERITRRFQALSLFASVKEILREDSITDAIDTGQELLPVLADRLCLTPPELRALRQAAPIVRPSGFMGSDDYLAALARLRAHHVPLHEWPGKGRPGQQAAWVSSPWLQKDGHVLVRADYHPADPVQIRDAVAAFEQDLLNPLIRSLSSGGIDTNSLRSSLTLVRSSTASTGEPKFEATLPLRPTVSDLHRAGVDRPSRSKGVSGSGRTLASPRRLHRRPSRRAPSRPAGVAHAVRFLDIALRRLFPRAAHDRSSARRRGQRPPTLRRHLLRYLPPRRHADPVASRQRRSRRHG